MKEKIVKLILVFILMFTIFSVFSVYATNNNENIIKNDTTGKLIEMKEKEKKSIEDYTEAYGSEAYGMAAYILNLVRIYSIPFCFVGIAIGAIYQYVIGIRKLDVRDKGFHTVIAFITILVICQILPLVFAIVVKGWRG